MVRSVYKAIFRFKVGMRFLKAILLIFFLLLSACKESSQIRKEPESRLFEDDLDRESLSRAIQQSLNYLTKIPPDRLVGEEPRQFTAQEVKESLLSFKELLDLWDQPEVLANEIQSRFDLYQPGGHGEGGEVLVTGYYQPIIEGSLTESPDHRFPVYQRPGDLIEVDLGNFRPQLRGEKVAGRIAGGRFVPYLSRHEIDGLGRLRGKGYEIAWVKDPVELFFLHIQGSGILQLGDDRLHHLNYAASNGRPYRSIGKVLLDNGKMEKDEISMQGLLRYLRDHPEERDTLFAQNERYIFFRFVENGPLGSLEVPLTPGRSLATDVNLPKGALAFLVTRRPLVDNSGKFVGWQPFSRFVLNQDTGIAIQGPKRADLYFGSGEKAGLAAGRMNAPGRLYFLIKKREDEVVKDVG